MHNDYAGAFTTGVIMSDVLLGKNGLNLISWYLNWNSDNTYHPLRLLGSEQQTLGVAVPSRPANLRHTSLQGLRFAFKDTIHIKGLTNSLCNKAFLAIT